MEIELNDEQNPLEHVLEENSTIKNRDDWMGLGWQLPAGLFYFDAIAGMMHVNPKLLEYLRLDQLPISPGQEEYFWSRRCGGTRC